MNVEKYIHEKLRDEKALLFSVLDPLDYPSLEDAVKTAKNMDEGGADALLIGGSTGVQGELLDSVTKQVKESVGIPVIFFPGNIGTVSRYGDAVYFMSLLNSRNPYWITRAQMLAAPMVKQYGIEPLPVGYIVIEPGGTVGWVGEANMLPRKKPQLAAAMALGAQYMGFRFVVTDAGSNPETGHIPLEMVKAVSSVLDVPYIVAGGIRTPEEAKSVIKSGADIVQVGTSFEKDGGAEAVKKFVKAVREGRK
jgi:phosphoglycerol geranylgeranyltransferase